jgi:ATP-dependent protease ClpP protease subunit
VSRDTDRDFILTAEEAKRYGVIDQVIDRRARSLAEFEPAEPPSGNGRSGP